MLQSVASIRSNFIGFLIGIIAYGVNVTFPIASVGHFGIDYDPLSSR